MVGNTENVNKPQNSPVRRKRENRGRFSKEPFRRIGAGYATFHTWQHVPRGDELLHAGIVSLGIALVTAAVFALAGVAGADLRQLVSNLTLSFFRVLTAYGISLFLAVGIAIGVTRNARVEALILPILDVLQSFPNFALLPLTVAWFGAGSSAVIFVLVITMVWPILFAVVAGTKAIRSELGEAADIFGARGVAKLRVFTLPALFPAMVSGSIVGWGEGWEAVVGAEIIVGSSGIGRAILDATKLGETKVIVITLIVLMYLIFLINTWFWLALLRRATQRSE